jgi:hypothetical protein
MKKGIVYCIFVFAMLNGLHAQKLKMTFGNGKYQVVVNNGAICSFGNYNEYPQIISKGLLINNTDKENSLKVTNYKVHYPDSKLSIYEYINQNSTSATIDHTQTLYSSGYYTSGSGIDTHINKISFNTNDPDNPTVEINFVVNPDKGNLTLLSEEIDITNGTINIGDIPIGTRKDFSLIMKNSGKGYMGLSPIEDLVTNNKLTSSVYNSTVLAPEGDYINNYFSFSAIKKGDINSSFNIPLYRGNKEKQNIIVTGKVIAPVTEVRYNSNIVANGSEITLPDNNYNSENYTFNLKNSGDHTLSVTGVSIENNGEMYIKTPLSHTKIEPGSERKISLNLIPASIGNKRFKVTVASDGYKTDIIEFFVNIKVVAPILTIEDETGKVYQHNEGYRFNYNGKGEFANKKLYIKNIGNKTLSIKSIEKNFDTYKSFNMTFRSKSDINPGDKTEISFSYKPETDFRKHEHYTMLEIKSDDLHDKSILFRISANNKYANIDVKQDKFGFEHNYTYEFDRTSVNIPKERTFDIINNGSVDLSLNNIQIIDNKSGYYTITEMPSKTVLKPGEKDNIKITYAPTRKDGTNSAKLYIKTNDYKCYDFNLKLQGHGIKPSMQLSQQNESFGISNNEICDYGIIDFDNFREQDYTFNNYGSDLLKVYDFTIENPDGGISEVSRKIEDDINYLEKTNFRIKYRCTKPGENIFTVRFRTNDYEKHMFAFKVMLFAPAPMLEIYDDKKLENNAVISLSDSKARVLTIKNNGTRNLNIKKAYLKGEQLNNFEVLMPKSNIGSGESETITIKCNANIRAEKRAKLIIESNDIIMPKLELNLIAKMKISTDINSNNMTNINAAIYPNPTTGEINITHNYKSAIDIIIYTSTGKIVYSGKHNKPHIKLNRMLKPGLYVVNIITNNSNTSKKLIVQ